MKRYRLAAEAERDLDEIWEFIAIEADSIVPADRVVDEITRRFRLFQQSPHAGRLRPDIGASIRSLPVGNYSIYYKITEDFIVILRIIHAARDQSSIFDNE